MYPVHYPQQPQYTMYASTSSTWHHITKKFMVVCPYTYFTHTSTTSHLFPELVLFTHLSPSFELSKVDTLHTEYFSQIYSYATELFIKSTLIFPGCAQVSKNDYRSENININTSSWVGFNSKNGYKFLSTPQCPDRFWVLPNLLTMGF